MTEESVTDRRRDAGARTKQRLMEATLTLLADRGEDGVTLRDITSKAETNVASVSYHFGSLGALCCATAKDAITRLLDEQTARLQALDDDATVHDIAGAIAQPIVGAISDPSSPHFSLLRIFDRTLSGPPGEMRDWLKASPLPRAKRREPDLGLAHVLRGLHVGDRHEAQSRVGELARDDLGEHALERGVDAAHAGVAGALGHVRESLFAFRDALAAAPTAGLIAGELP